MSENLRTKKREECHFGYSAIDHEQSEMKVKKKSPKNINFTFVRRSVENYLRICQASKWRFRRVFCVVVENGIKKERDIVVINLRTSNNI